MKPDQNQKNIRAWDQLYESSESNVWGNSPLPFLADQLSDLSQLIGDSDEILDAGTGEGRNLSPLLQLGGKLHACDASGHALAAIPSEIKSQVTQQCCDLSQTPYKTHQFRLITLLDVFETLPCPELVLPEIHRILKPQGYLFVNIPDLRDSISETEMESIWDKGYLYKGKYYYRFYSEEEVLKLITPLGFIIKNTKLYTWEEEPHVGYRDSDHSHTSTVYLIQKT